ncbi:hypothetical protein EI94DRAFT_1798579 [Lactarius quietus]|nr:hypothetical protein EI94DRAFT_1798579 [Lactarius quietus]
MPEYGPSALPPTSVTHVHTYPPPGSPSIPYTEGDGEPLRHPYDPASQYVPSQPIHVPVSGAPSRRTRASRAPTVVEVTGPEPIHIHPPHDEDEERGVSTPYHPPVSGPISDIYGEEGRRGPTLESQLRGADPSITPRRCPRRCERVPPGGAPEGAPSEEGARSLEGSPYARSGTPSDVRPIPEPQTRGHIVPGPPSEPYEPYQVPRSPTYSDEEPRDAPTIPGGRTPGVSRAPTTRSVPRTVRRFPSGPGDLEYDDAERARQQRFGELERQLADITQDAAEAEVRRDHEFQDREADRDRHFGENESRREADARHIMDEMSSLLAQAQPPLAGVPGVPSAEFPESEVPPLPVPAESVIASIRRASSESAARHADDIRDIVQGEREEMAKALQLERDDARAAQEALQHQILEERARADQECRDHIQELQDELARVRAELENEKQQRINDEEMRREDEARRGGERDEDMKQQLNEITELLLGHREEFARKKEAFEEHWVTKEGWREEDRQRWDDLYRMVQGLIRDQAEDRERCEDERRAAAERPTTEEIMNTILAENQSLRELFDTLTHSWREDTANQHKELLDTIKATANERVPFNVQGYLDEFSKSLATEVRMLLGEVGKLREERRNIQFEIGTLLCLRSKYEAGGMFDPDWKPSTHPLGPQAPVDLPPDEPAPGPEPPRPGAWRSKSEARPGPVIETPSMQPPPGPPPPDRAQAAGSWATWQVQPGVEYTPPPSEPTVHLAPEVPQQRGLFGPRSPRGSG